jgi:hypothetical protein
VNGFWFWIESCIRKFRKSKIYDIYYAGEDDLDFNIDSNLMDNLDENINLYIHGVYP